MNIPQRIAAGVILTMLAGCLNSFAGVSPNVPLSDFFGQKPKVQIAWPNMVLTVPTNYPSSVAYVSPKVRIEGTNVLIDAKYVPTKKPATTTFNLKKLGMKPDNVTAARVFWMNPDGTRKELEVLPSHPTQ